MKSSNSIVKIYEFTGTVSTEVTIEDENFLKYRYIILTLYDSDLFIINSVIIPRGTFHKDFSSIKIYGKSENVWGSMQFAIGTNTNKFLFNRTSANTSRLILFGAY